MRFRYLPNRRKQFRESWDLSANTVAHYKCNDDAANTTVTNEEGTDATSSTNTSNLSIVGKINDAFDFTASLSEQANTNQNFSTTLDGEHSYAFWLQLDDGQPSGDQCPFGGGNGNDFIQIFIQSTGKLRVIYRSNGNQAIALTNSAVFSDGATSWAHFIITISSTNIKIYKNTSEETLDGTLDGDMTGVTLGDYSSSENVYIGAMNDNSSIGNYWDGAIDDIRLMDKVISQTEIDGLYNSGNGTEALSG